MDAPKLNPQDTLKESYPKLNQSIDNANEALRKSEIANAVSDNAVKISNEAKGIAERTQTELSQAILDGDSSPLAGQLSVGADGTVYADGPQGRLVSEFNRTLNEINVVKRKAYERIFKPYFDRSISMGNVSDSTGGSNIQSFEWIENQLSQFIELGVDGIYIIIVCGINSSNNQLFLAGGSDVYDKINFTINLAKELGLDIRSIKFHSEERGRQLRLETIQNTMGISSFQLAYTNLLKDLLTNFSKRIDKFIILNERYYFYTDSRYDDFCISLLDLIKSFGLKGSISSGFTDFLNMTNNVKDAIDFICINDYYDVSAKGIDTTRDEAINGFSRQISVTTYIPHMLPNNKPFYITETGCLDIEEALHVGWQWEFSDMSTHNGKIQEIFLTGFFEIYKDLNIAGVGYWWDINLNNANLIKRYLGKEY